MRMGTPLGTLLGLAMGGRLVADAYGWRTAFFVAGAPGILVAVIAALTLREPRKRLAARAAQTRAASASLGQTMAYLAVKPTFWLFAFAAAILAFVGYGDNAFISSFYLRNHAPEVAHLAAGFGLQSRGFIGLAIGLVGGLTGAVGSLMGGRLTDRCGLWNAKAFATMPAVISLIWAPLFVLVILAPNALTSLAISFLPSLLGTFWYGPIYGTVQSVAPGNMRSTAAALLLFIINIIGLGLGPLAFGVFSDFLAGPRGPARRRGGGTLVASALASLPAVGLLLLARRTIQRDLVS